MQAHSSKTTSKRCYEKVSTIVAYTCILIGLNSCSSSENSKTLSTQSKMKRVCLSGSGKGRVRIGRNKSLFRYESKLNQDKKYWRMVLDLPIHGEEMIGLKWANGQKMWSASFIKALESEEDKYSAPQLRKAKILMKSLLSYINFGGFYS